MPKTSLPSQPGSRPLGPLTLCPEPPPPPLACCPQVRVSGGLQQYLPSFLPSLLGLGACTAVDKLALDGERHILYALMQSGAIQVRGGGAGGLGGWEGEAHNLCAHAVRGHTGEGGGL